MDDELRQPAPVRHDQRKKATASLIIIGGHEDRLGKTVVLEEVAQPTIA